MTQSTPPIRRRAKRERQEGIVLLVVLVLLLMATSTAVWAMQSTLFEQKASISIVDVSFSRTESECSAMLGVALEEQTYAPSLDVNWTTGAAPNASYTTKYSWPAINTGIARTPTATGGATFPNGAAAYACGVGRSAPWTFRSHRLHEVYPLAPPPTASALPPPTLVVITGFGELAVTGDETDSNGVRGIHEVDTMTRAYFER